MRHFNLFISLFILTLAFSCNKTERIEISQIEKKGITTMIDDLLESSPSTDPLTYKLQENANFLSISRYLKIRNEEIKAFMIANDAAIIADATVLSDFINTYTKHQVKILKLFSNLQDDFPQLAAKDRTISINILHTALSIAKDQGYGNRSCSDACQDAYFERMDLAYEGYLTASHSCYYNGGDYDECNDLWYKWFCDWDDQFNLPAYYRCTANC